MSFDFTNIKKSILIVCAAVILIIALAIFLFSNALADDRIAIRNPVRVLTNPKVNWIVPEADVTSLGKDNWNQLEIGYKLSAEERIRTGEYGNVDISFADGSLVRVAENTIVTISDLTLKKVDISLEKGSLVSKFKKVTGSERHEITTPSVVCGVRGTELIVEIGESETVVYGMSGETEVFSIDSPGSPVLVGFQQKTLTKDGEIPAPPIDMTQEEVKYFRRLLSSIHSSEVFFVASELQFKPDSAVLVEGSAESLGELATIIKKKRLTIEIVGHTADIGDRASQYELSWKRAATVKEVLLSLGVKDKSLTTAGYGGLKPIADNSTAEGRASNRRVEFLIKED